MNWKHLLVVVLAALIAVTACKKKAEEAPAEQPAAEQPAEQPPAEQPPAEQPPAEQPPAEQPPAEQPPAEQPPAEGGDACQAYIDGMMKCAKEAAEAAAAGSWTADVEKMWKESQATACDAFKQSGMMDYMAKAMEDCKDTPCGAGGADWAMCVSTKATEAMTAAAMAGAGAP
ncbi:MAG: hypothetical protein JXB32_21025 [Deltaproteobacteria bacterium]|nr:hypothetical protein [Deltaproteobacteria bacterium]